jgi:hypothetical protein
MITAIETVRNAWKFDRAGLPSKPVLYQMLSVYCAQNTSGLTGIADKRNAGRHTGIDSI